MARLSLCCCSMLASVARRIALISDMRLISRINSSSGRSRINSVSGRPVRLSRHSFAIASGIRSTASDCFRRRRCRSIVEISSCMAAMARFSSDLRSSMFLARTCKLWVQSFCVLSAVA
uniref:Putative secreted protein n=1 Tax=Anopheles darlingi TaxID=43151 RepID=A0A2M4DN22_ANODA